MKLEVLIDGEKYDVEIKKKNGQMYYTFNGEEIPFELKETSPSEITFTSERKRFPFYYVRKNSGKYLVSINNCSWDISVIDIRSKILGRVGGGEEQITEVTAPMPGKVVRVEVKKGEKVKKNQVLLAIEAMKMENLIKSPRDGIIEDVLVTEGDSVEAKAVLVRFKKG